LKYWASAVAPLDGPVGEAGTKEEKIMGFLSSENLSSFTFDGVRRGLGMHPESLSRALDRLEEDGFLTRTDEGYSVVRSFEYSRVAASSRETIPLMQTVLPRGFRVEYLAPRLVGSWFGSLRWLGLSKNEQETVLNWTTENGGVLVRARFGGSSLSVEAKIRVGVSIDDAIKGSYELLGQLSWLFTRRGERTLKFWTLAEPETAVDVTGQAA